MQPLIHISDIRPLARGVPPTPRCRVRPVHCVTDSRGVGEGLHPPEWGRASTHQSNSSTADPPERRSGAGLSAGQETVSRTNPSQLIREHFGCCWSLKRPAVPLLATGVAVVHRGSSFCLPLRSFSISLEPLHHFKLILGFCGCFTSS